MHVVMNNGPTKGTESTKKEKEKIKLPDSRSRELLYNLWVEVG